MMERLGEMRRERIEKGSRERIEKRKRQRELDDNLKTRRRNITTCLSSFLKSLRYNSEDMSSRLDSTVKRCSSEVLVSSGEVW